jgi:hypothetical protein
MREASMRRGARRLYCSGCAAALAAALISTPVHAVTCQEVRLMTRGEIAYWAKRLEMSPDKLAALLKKAFCDVPAGRELDTDLFAARR